MKKYQLSSLTGSLLLIFTSVALPMVSSTTYVSDDHLYHAIADAYVEEMFPASNFGEQYSFDVGNVGNLSTYALLKFNLSEIGANVTIKSAVLRIKTGLVPNAVSVEVRLGSNNWTELGVNWITKPVLYEPSAILLVANNWCCAVAG